MAEGINTPMPNYNVRSELWNSSPIMFGCQTVYELSIVDIVLKLEAPPENYVKSFQRVIEIYKFNRIHLPIIGWSSFVNY
jgi:hypothetical protein